jgi:GLPGLI family protein
MIDSYLCFKATADLNIKNSSGIFKRKIIAWYCPKIPFSYGPKGFGNLPGLILQLQERNVIFGAKKINLNKDLRALIKPAKVKIIGQDEYSKILNSTAPK